jgi:hypothetical protein
VVLSVEEVARLLDSALGLEYMSRSSSGRSDRPADARVSRPALEVADIFRSHGPAWRQADACAYRKSNPAILMVQSAEDWTADNASGCLGGA